MKPLFSALAMLALVALTASAGEPALLNTKPAGAISVTKARSLKPNDKVVVSGEIAGRKSNLFHPTLSTFFLADPDVLVNCQRKGCGCPTPWDYCCEPKEKIAAHIALIQFKNGGKVDKKSLKGWHGLKELSKVVVVGTVDPVSSPASLVVNAESIYIQP